MKLDTKNKGEGSGDKRQKGMMDETNEWTWILNRVLFAVCHLIVLSLFVLLPCILLSKLFTLFGITLFLLF